MCFRGKKGIREGERKKRGKIGVNKGEKEERLVNHCASEKFPIKWIRRDFMNTFREGESLITRGISAQNLGPIFLSRAESIAVDIREISKLVDENLVLCWWRGLLK